MSEYEKYSRDIWDYIEHFPYMPSRKDREKLFADTKKHKPIEIDGIEYTRVQLWDYFFRIRPEDVGQPQRREIARIKKEIREKVSNCQENVRRLLEKIVLLEEKARQEVIMRAGGSIIALALFILALNFIPSIESFSIRRKISFFLAISLSWALFSGFLIYFLYSRGDEKKEIQSLKIKIEMQKRANFQEVDEAKKRISFLKKEVARLRRQIPKPLPDVVVRRWLNLEYDGLWERTKVEIALVRELIETPLEHSESNIQNPLYVIGPGEVQEKKPRRFWEDVNPDLNKHISAKQSYPLDQRNRKGDIQYDVLYGVYFLEYIVVGEDMLVTHSFFYDFIDDRVTSEYTTEQYYTDVVALAIKKGFQEFTTINRDGVTISFYVDDAPTFTLSLKSGETHKVAFVSENYFMNVRDRLNISPDEIGQIYWIDESQRVAENVIKSLRYYLRQHKAL